MAVDDLWFTKKKGPDGKWLPSKRHGRGKRWRVRVKDDSGKVHFGSHHTKKEADRQDAKMRADLARGEFIDPNAGKVTFRTYAARWFENQVHEPATRAQVETHLRLHVVSFFGDRALDSILPTDVQAWVKDMSGHLAPATVRVIYSYGAAIFTAAVRDDYRRKTPCIGIRLPKIEHTETDPLPQAVIDALLDAVPARYRALVLVGAMAGLRQGEALGLEVSRVEFLRKPSIRVDQQLQRLPGAPPYLKGPKTRSSIRTVPIGQVLKDALALHLRDFPAPEVKLSYHASGRPPVTRVARLIFTKPDGTPIDRAWFGRMWRPAMRAALKAYVEAAPTQDARADAQAVVDQLAKASFHDLRHFYASFLIAHGASVKEVQRRLGHASAIETLTTYAHLWPDSSGDIEDAFDQAFGADQGDAGQGAIQAAGGHSGAELYRMFTRH